MGKLYIYNVPDKRTQVKGKKETEKYQVEEKSLAVS